MLLIRNYERFEWNSINADPNRTKLTRRVSLLLFRYCRCCNQRLLTELLLSSIADAADAPAVAADRSTVVVAATDPEPEEFRT